MEKDSKLGIMFAMFVLSICFSLAGCGYETKRYTISDISTYMQDFDNEERLFADISYVNEKGETETISVYASKDEQDTTNDTFQLPTTLKNKHGLYSRLDADFEKQSDDKDTAEIEIVGDYVEVKIILPDDTYNTMLDEFCNSIEYTKIYPNN